MEKLNNTKKENIIVNCKHERVLSFIINFAAQKRAEEKEEQKFKSID